jgi:hypothetical protein
MSRSCPIARAGNKFWATRIPRQARASSKELARQTHAEAIAVPSLSFPSERCSGRHGSAFFPATFGARDIVVSCMDNLAMAAFCAVLAAKIRRKQKQLVSPV